MLSAVLKADFEGHDFFGFDGFDRDVTVRKGFFEDIFHRLNGLIFKVRNGGFFTESLEGFVLFVGDEFFLNGFDDSVGEFRILGRFWEDVLKDLEERVLGRFGSDFVHDGSSGRQCCLRASRLPSTNRSKFRIRFLPLVFSQTEERCALIKRYEDPAESLNGFPPRWGQGRACFEFESFGIGEFEMSFVAVHVDAGEDGTRRYRVGKEGFALALEHCGEEQGSIVGVNEVKIRISLTGEPFGCHGRMKTVLVPVNDSFVWLDSAVARGVRRERGCEVDSTVLEVWSIGCDP